MYQNVSFSIWKFTKYIEGGLDAEISISEREWNYSLKLQCLRETFYCCANSLK